MFRRAEMAELTCDLVSRGALPAEVVIDDKPLSSIQEGRSFDGICVLHAMFAMWTDCSSEPVVGIQEDEVARSCSLACAREPSGAKSRPRPLIPSHALKR